MLRFVRLVLAGGVAIGLVAGCADDSTVANGSDTSEPTARSNVTLASGGALGGPSPETAPPGLNARDAEQLLLANGLRFDDGQEYQPTQVSCTSATPTQTGPTFDCEITSDQVAKYIIRLQASSVAPATFTFLRFAN